MAIQALRRRYAMAYMADRASGPGVPSPKPIADFLSSHPQAKRFAEAS